MWEVLLYERVSASLSLNHANLNWLIIVSIFTKQAEITLSNGVLLPLSCFNRFKMTAVCITSLSQCFRIYKNNYIFVILLHRPYTQQTTAGLLSKEKKHHRVINYVMLVMYQKDFPPLY